jgi:hypothetical protein
MSRGTTPEEQLCQGRPSSSSYPTCVAGDVNWAIIGQAGFTRKPLENGHWILRWIRQTKPSCHLRSDDRHRQSSNAIRRESESDMPSGL